MMDFKDVPRTIKGRKLTHEEKLKFIKNELTKATLYGRLQKGIPWDEIFEPKRSNNRREQNRVLGVKLTKEQLDYMKTNGITKELVARRVSYHGWEFERAIKTPKMRRGRLPQGESTKYVFTPSEIMEIIGRVKYMNNNYKEYQQAPIAIPEGVLNRAKEYKIDLATVEEVKV